MKNLKIASLFFFFFLVAATVNAQVPKVPSTGAGDISKQLLGILDNTSGLNLTGDQTSKLKANNKSFVDQLMKITGGSDSEDKKKSSILNLKNSRMSFLTSLLGNDLTQKYMGSVLKAINPMKSKLGLAALAF